MKAKRIKRTKPKLKTVSPKKNQNKKPLIQANAAKKSTVEKNKTTSIPPTAAHPKNPLPPELDINLKSVEGVSAAWELLADEDFMFDDDLWDTFYDRMKMRIHNLSYAFQLDESTQMSPYALTPMPAMRNSELDWGYLKSGQFTIVRPELPAVAFDLKISSELRSISFEWYVQGVNEMTGHIALYINGALSEALNLVSGRCRFEIKDTQPREFTFYFLDAISLKQHRVLDIEI